MEFEVGCWALGAESRESGVNVKYGSAAINFTTKARRTQRKHKDYFFVTFVVKTYKPKRSNHGRVAKHVGVLPG